MREDRAFLGDGNDLLRGIQAHEERWVMRRLAVGAVQRVRTAARVLSTTVSPDVDVELAHALVLRGKLRLELAHDVLAAAYRQRNPDLGQHVLGFLADSQRHRLTTAWVAWAHARIDELLDAGEVCVPVVRAVLLAGRAAGNRAERRVVVLVVRHLYRDLPPSSLGWPLGAAGDLARRTSHVWNGNPLAPLFALTAPG